MAKYIRFITLQLDILSQRPQGIFHTLYELRDEGKLENYQTDLFNESAMWFEDNLQIPDKFCRSTKAHAKSSGICWYKNSAHEHINRMYELVNVLKLHDVEVEVLKSDKPGYIVYDDEFQIVAEPFVETIGKKLKR